MATPAENGLSQALEESAQYPAQTRQASAEIDGELTAVTSTFFTDKIMITISQKGRLAQWLHVPLDVSDSNFANERLPSSDDDNLLPLAHLSPRTLLGASTSERETLGHLYATQIATAVIARNPEEQRAVLVGLGLSKFRADREFFYDVIDLVIKCL